MVQLVMVLQSTGQWHQLDNHVPPRGGEDIAGGRGQCNPGLLSEVRITCTFVHLYLSVPVGYVAPHLFMEPSSTMWRLTAANRLSTQE